MDYNRNESRKSSSVDDEVQKLLRRGNKVSSQDFMRLRSMYKDEEIVNKLQNAYIEKQGNIVKKAKKFAQLIREKYSESQTPFHLLLEKAYKYKTKYGLTDDEFAEFQRIYEQELVGLKSVEVLQPATNLMKVLGGVTLDYHGFANKLNDVDMKYLQELMKLHASSRALHAQVLLQSLQYTDCDYEALTGRYNRDLHRVGEHIHPVVAALFLPKFPVVESHFLFSNIAGIVKARYNGEALESRPDYELFYALTTDPNDVVCDSKSTMLDLLNRAQLQTQLWNNVLHLRNGQYYNASFKDLVTAVDMCRLNKQDTPDLVYGRYDGVIVKRLLSAFSFRPTVVATTPLLMNPVSFNPYAFNVKPQVTSVPMINMRLPPVSSNNSGPVDLNSALEQSQFFLEGGAIVPKNTSLIWSRGVLIFYVDRRATNIQFNNQLQAFSMSQLPNPIAGFEKLNTRQINYDNTIPIRDEKYELRSVVYSDVNIRDGKETDLVIGSSALIRLPANQKSGRGSAKHLCYDPYGPVNSRSGLSDADTNPPITSISDEDPKLELSFRGLAVNRGTIFVYASDGDIDKKQEIAW